jgi:hypothetical protein
MLCVVMPSVVVLNVMAAFRFFILPTIAMKTAAFASADFVDKI